MNITIEYVNPTGDWTYCARAEVKRGDGKIQTFYSYGNTIGIADKGIINQVEKFLDYKSLPRSKVVDVPVPEDDKAFTEPGFLVPNNNIIDAELAQRQRLIEEA